MNLSHFMKVSINLFHHLIEKILFIYRNFPNIFCKKSVSRSLSAETRWRACEEAFAAAAGPKRREALATGARQKKSVSRLLSAETRWRACEEAFAAQAGPKRREALATGARHRKLDAGFYKKTPIH
jgi:hypothetical protein